MSNLVKINDAGFNKMVGHLRNGTSATVKDITRIIAGRVLQNAASDTGKSNYKKIVSDVDRTLGRTFISSLGLKIRKAKDGSLVVKSGKVTNNKWVRVRDDFKLNAIKGKNPSGRSFTKLQTGQINKSLSEMRKKRSSLLKEKKKNIASGQATFILMLRKLKIPLKNPKKLAAALKVKLPLKHAQAVSAKGTQVTKDQYIIILKSKSKAALNPHAKGLDSFRKAFNSQIKGFEESSKRGLKKFVKQFAQRNGFTVR